MEDFNTTSKNLLVKKESLEETLNSFIACQIEGALNQLLEEEFLANLADYLASDLNTTKPNSHNVFYERIINFHGYTINVRIPRDRLSKLKTALLKPYSRRIGESLNEMICRLYLKGLTNSEIEHFLKLEYGDGANALSEQIIMKMTKNIVNLSKDFHERSLLKCVAVYLDATYVPLRRIYKEKSDSYEKEAILMALGITEDDKKEILDYKIVPNEGASKWAEFLENLKSRNIGSSKYFITDGLCGMPEAAKSMFPDATLQRCLVHIQRNLCKDFRKKDVQEITNDFSEVYSQESLEKVEQKLKEFVSKWSSTYPSFNKLLTTPGLLEFYKAPKEMR